MGGDGDRRSAQAPSRTYLLPDLAVASVTPASNTPSAPLGTVWWAEEPERKRQVKRVCGPCHHITAIASLDEVYIVSPAGIAHAESEIREGCTACGKNATGEDWWWREY